MFEIAQMRRSNNAQLESRLRPGLALSEIRSLQLNNSQPFFAKSIAALCKTAAVVEFVPSVSSNPQ
jgi:hypothetical protein